MKLREIGTYKGKPTITLRRTEEDKFPFTMGLSKAKLVMQNIDAIEKFVKAFDVPEAPTTGGEELV